MKLVCRCNYHKGTGGLENLCYQPNYLKKGIYLWLVFQHCTWSWEKWKWVENTKAFNEIIAFIPQSLKNEDGTKSSHSVQILMSLTTYESPGMNIAYGRIGTIKDYCIILKQSWLLPLARWMEREWWHCLCVCLLYFKCTLSNQTKLHASFGIFCLIIRQSLLLIICTFFLSQNILKLKMKCQNSQDAHKTEQKRISN